LQSAWPQHLSNEVRKQFSKVLKLYNHRG